MTIRAMPVEKSALFFQLLRSHAPKFLFFVFSFIIPVPLLPDA